MATYAIGDVQGCFNELLALMKHISFDPRNDTLWFAGDLVNRGPKSLDVLKWIYEVPQKIIVLGNHDLHLLACAHGAIRSNNKDTIQDVLDDPECDKLCQWLIRQPLIHHDANLDISMVHAGIPPIWSIDKALKEAKYVENMLKSDDATDVFKHMYGDEPHIWDDSLQGYERMRIILNYLTRMRFVSAEGALSIKHKKIGTQPPDLAPWFKLHPHNRPILFGHWAALEGHTDIANRIALDAGCVWGNRLKAYRLEDKQSFYVKSHHKFVE